MFSSKKNDPDLQFAQTIQTDIAVWFVEDSKSRNLSSEVIYEGILNTDALAKSVIGEHFHDKIYGLLARKWRLNDHEDFITKSGYIIFLKVTYSGNIVLVQTEFYKTYADVNKRTPIETTNPNSFEM